MLKKDFDTFAELPRLIKAIPAPATVVFDVMTYQKACNDYQTALFYISEILTNYSTYEKWKSRLGKGEIDDDFILDCKDKVNEYMERFREFVKERNCEGWE